MKKLSKYIDHTLLKADATQQQIIKICDEAKEYDFYSVCVNSCHVPLVARELVGSDVKVCSVVGFPLGAMQSDAKAYEAALAVEQGADEIDMVINIGWLKSAQYDKVAEDIKLLRQASKDAVLKVIIETALLNKDEIIKVCQIAKDAGADFVKTSTGFSTSGAKIEDVKLMREVVGEDMGVKASGGIRDYKSAIAMIEAGANRLGVSAGVAIVTGAEDSKEGY